MPKIGRARIIRELDNQYTLMVYRRDPDVDGVPSRERLQSTTPNLNLATAFNNARDELNAMATGNEKHEEVTIMTRIEAD